MFMNKFIGHILKRSTGFLALGLLAAGVWAATPAHAQDQGQQRPLFGVFSGGSQPIDLQRSGRNSGQGSTNRRTGSSSQQAIRPYQRGGANRSAGGGSSFADAMRALDEQNYRNSQAAAAERQRITDAVVQQHLNRLETRQQDYEERGVMAPAEDPRRQVYQPRQSTSDRPARLFNTR